MTERAAYSEEEWAQLMAAPVAVIAAVIGISPGGPVAIMQEVGAAVRWFEQTAAQRSENPLFAAMLLHLKESFDAFSTGKGKADEVKVDLFELGRDPARSVELCRTTAALLERKAPPELSAEVRNWLLDLAVAVAEAAREGGFMGIGGEQVNAKERTMIAELAAALGLDRV